MNNPIFFLFLTLAFFVKESIAQAPITEQLLVFVDKNKPVLSEADRQTLLELASKSAVQVEFVDVNAGVPKEITYTPTIVFQNYLGRSTYYGRYKNTSRLRNFIRTSRLAHQKNTANIKKDILVWENEKATIIAPLKITALEGKLPTDFDAAAFAKAAKAAVAEGVNAFQKTASFANTRSTRAFYINLYPYINSKKQLTISAELFSQYNCVKPVFQQYDLGIVTGKWKKRNTLFAKAGRLIEQEIQRQIKASDIGDAFEVIPTTVATTTWDEMGFPLPTPPSRSAIFQQTDEVDIPQNWEIAPSENTNEPLVIFSFLPPLDSYAGEVKALSGSLQLHKKSTLKGATGNFEVAVTDVTMGAADFDAEVHHKMLQKARFPTSSFVFEKISATDTPLEVGKVTAFLVSGRFHLLGKSISLDVPATIEPFYTKNGELRLQVNASFALPLFEQFEVAGPDGPSPAKDTLQFFMKFYLQPK